MDDELFADDELLVYDAQELRYHTAHKIIDESENLDFFQISEEL